MSIPTRSSCREGAVVRQAAAGCGLNAMESPSSGRACLRRVPVAPAWLVGQGSSLRCLARRLTDRMTNTANGGRRRPSFPTDRAAVGPRRRRYNAPRNDRTPHDRTPAPEGRGPWKPGLTELIGRQAPYIGALVSLRSAVLVVTSTSATPSGEPETGATQGRIRTIGADGMDDTSRAHDVDAGYPDPAVSRTQRRPSTTSPNGSNRIRGCKTRGGKGLEGPAWLLLGPIGPPRLVNVAAKLRPWSFRAASIREPFGPS